MDLVSQAHDGEPGDGARFVRDLPEEVRRLLPALTLFDGVADADVLGILSTIDSVPDRFRDVARDRWTATLDQAVAPGLLARLWGGQYRIHPTLPAGLDRLWRDEAGAGYASERERADSAFVTAASAYGGWLLRQLEGGAAETAMAVIDLQRRTMERVIDRALSGRRWREAQRVLQPLNAFWQARGLHAEAQAWTTRILGLVEDRGGTAPDLQTPAGALWLFVTGETASRAQMAGETDTAYAIRDRIRKALEASPWETARPHLAVTYHHLGMVVRDRGDLDGAARWYRAAQEIWGLLGDRRGVAQMDHQLGMLAQQRGDITDAEHRYLKSLEINQALGNRPGAAATLHQLGDLALLRDDLNGAERRYRQSLEIRQALGDQPGLASGYHQLGLVAQERGDPDGAERWYKKAIEIKEA